MNTQRRIAAYTITLSFTVLLLSLAGARAESAGGKDIAARAEAAAPMAASRLAALYRGKSWIWPDGAGYFDPSGRFTAWSGSGSSASYAVGQWKVNNHGRLCMQAIWHSATGATENNNCFVHRVRGDLIYQAKAGPGGVQENSWYVFKNAPPQADDEFGKLKEGDLVSKDLAGIKSQIPEKELPRKRKFTR